MDNLIEQALANRASDVVRIDYETCKACGGDPTAKGGDRSYGDYTTAEPGHSDVCDSTPVFLWLNSDGTVTVVDDTNTASTQSADEAVSILIEAITQGATLRAGMDAALASPGWPREALSA